MAKSPKLRARDYMRRALYELDKNRYVPSDFYREYTRALTRQLSDLTILEKDSKKRKISIFYGNPERAIAKIKEDRNIILPVVSVSIDDLDEDITRRRTDTCLETETYWDKEEQRAIRIVSLPPKAVVLTYSINVFAKYTEDMNQLIEQIHMKFQPAMDIRTKFSSNTKAFLSDLSDESSTAPSDQQDRILKKKVYLSIETYVPNRKYRITSTGEIEEYNYEFDVEDSE